MKKNILIIFLALISIASIAYGYSQKIEADQQRQRADLQAELAGLNMMEAIKQRQIAEQQRMEAQQHLKVIQAQMLQGE